MFNNAPTSETLILRGFRGFFDLSIYSLNEYSSIYIGRLGGQDRNDLLLLMKGN